jgi:hypothetical protein
MRARRTSFWPVEGERITVSVASLVLVLREFKNWFRPSHAADNAQIADEFTYQPGDRWHVATALCLEEAS